VDITKTCLVLDARKLERLRMDGPALRVTMREQSSLLFPLRRLDRIHIIGNLHEGLDALVTCAERQIPIAFFSATGKLRCQLYYPVVEHTQLSHWLEHIEFDVEASEQYSEWLNNQQAYFLSTLTPVASHQRMRLQCLQETIHHLGRKVLGERQYHLAQEWLEGICITQLSQLIVNHGFANNSRGKQRLMDDLLPLFCLWLGYQLATQLERDSMAINGKTMSGFYQSQSDALAYMGRRMLAQLASRLEAII
jgi:hypothetical protein